MEDIGIGILQMMENAGRSLAWLSLELYSPRSVTILAGPGGNGGGGMVAARHLVNRRVRVRVVLAILRSMGVGVSDEPPTIDRPDVIIDALVGYSLAGPPHGRIATLIAWANGYDGPVISLDVPSGFDTQRGVGLTPCIRGNVTLMTAAPKVGLVDAIEAGRTYLADISVPTDVYRAFGYVDPVIFEDDWVVEVIAGAQRS